MAHPPGHRGKHHVVIVMPGMVIYMNGRRA